LFIQEFEENEKNPEVECHDFTRFIFPDISLSQLVFKKAVWFTGARFLGEVDFSGCHFEGRSAYFSRTIFEKKVDFSRAVFLGEETDFTEASFSGEVIFLGSKFPSKTTFMIGTKFLGGVSFRGIPPTTVFEKKAHLRNLIIDSSRHFVLWHVNLSQVEFRGTNLRQASMLDVDWAKIEKRFLGVRYRKRNTVYDELQLRGSEQDDKQTSLHSEYEYVESLCRGVRQNYEANGNYAEAGDFYYGEMDTRRLKLSPIRRYFFSWEALYWIVSGYGQRWENSFALLVLTFLVFPIFFMFGGLQTPPENGLPGKYISYDTALNLPRASQALADYELCLRYSILTILPMKESSFHYSPTIVTRYLLVAEIILLPTFATLFILALRRRFKR
jgi:uncharacterized protein YjbI with pentapeptide repeats